MPSSSSPEGLTGAQSGERTAPPADGLPPAGTPVPTDAVPPGDAGVQRDGAGAVGLVAKLRAVLRVRDFRKLWLSMSLSSFGDWPGVLAITGTAPTLSEGFSGVEFFLCSLVALP